MLADFELPSNWTKCGGDGNTIFSKVQSSSLRGSVFTNIYLWLVAVQMNLLEKLMMK